MTEEELKNNLQNILVDILVNKKDRYDELFEHEFIVNKIKGDSWRFHKKTGLELDDIENVARYIIYNDLENNFRVKKEEVIAKEFLERMNRILFLRLFNYYDNINYLGGDKDNKEISLESMGVPIEILNQDYVESNFEDEVISKIDLEEFILKLSDREKEIFEMIFDSDYTMKEVGDEIGIKKTTVQSYKERILKKFKKYVVRFQV